MGGPPLQRWGRELDAPSDETPARGRAAHATVNAGRERGLRPPWAGRPCHELRVGFRCQLGYPVGCTFQTILFGGSMGDSAAAVAEAWGEELREGATQVAGGSTTGAEGQAGRDLVRVPGQENAPGAEGVAGPRRIRLANEKAHRIISPFRHP